MIDLPREGEREILLFSSGKDKTYAKLGNRNKDNCLPSVVSDHVGWAT